MVKKYCQKKKKKTTIVTSKQFGLKNWKLKESLHCQLVWKTNLFWWCLWFLVYGFWKGILNFCKSSIPYNEAPRGGSDGQGLRSLSNTYLKGTCSNIWVNLTKKTFDVSKIWVLELARTFKMKKDNEKEHLYLIASLFYFVIFKCLWIIKYVIISVVQWIKNRHQGWTSSQSMS